jgi:hypothetical protein
MELPSSTPLDCEREADLALIAAARCGDEFALREALDRGARGLLADPFGQTALMLAASDGRANLVELLLPVSDPEALSPADGRGAIHCAVDSVGRDAPRCCELLAAAGCADLRSRIGWPAKDERPAPLHLALFNAHMRLVGSRCSLGHALAIVRALVVSGADVNLKGGHRDRSAMDWLSPYADRSPPHPVWLAIHEGLAERDRRALLAAADSACPAGEARHAPPAARL